MLFVPRTASVPALSLAEGAQLSAAALASALVHAIASGQLADGDVLPSSRSLAAALAVGRGRVVEAYQQLAASGFVVAVPGGVTRVEPGAAAAARAGAFVSLAKSAEESSRAARTGQTRSGSARFDLRPGYPDVSLISMREWNRCWRAAAQGYLAPGRALVDDATRSLRADLADHLRISRGVAVDPEHVLLFPSVHSAISLITSVAADRTRRLAFENPGYDKALRAFERGGARTRPVAVDEGGLRVGDLTAQDWGVYVTPAHQFPMGSRMPVTRRHELLEWAERADAWVFEDDYDGEFRYDVAPMPPVRAMQSGPERVIYLGTASKVLSREMRIAWAVVPDALRGPLAERVARDGDGVNAVAAAALSEFIAGRALVRHLAAAHRTYAARRHRFASACAAALPQARIHGIEAGLHFVLTFHGDFDDRAAVAELEQAGLLCAPLSQYSWGTTAVARGLVCGYALLPETRAAAAASVLREVLGRDG